MWISQINIVRMQWNTNYIKNTSLDYTFFVWFPDALESTKNRHYYYFCCQYLHNRCCWCAQKYRTFIGIIIPDSSVGLLVYIEHAVFGVRVGKITEKKNVDNVENYHILTRKHVTSNPYLLEREDTLWFPNKTEKKKRPHACSTKSTTAVHRCQISKTF